MSWDITGIGAVAVNGWNAMDIHAALCTGLTGRRSREGDRYRSPHTYRIDDGARMGRGDAGRATKWLCEVVDSALADAGVDTTAVDCPILVGTTMREQRSVELWWIEQQPLTLGELHFGTALRKRFGATRSYTFANGRAASLYSLGLATDLIESGQSDMVVVASTDAITESAAALFDPLPDPARATPWSDRCDHRRILSGEGAAAVVLQREGTGSRCARAKVRGVSLNCDASQGMASDLRSITDAMRQAHARARVSSADIDLVMLHGSGTDLDEHIEMSALSTVFADHDPGPLMTAVRPGGGPALGGSGLLSLVMAVCAMETGAVPPEGGNSHPIAESAGFLMVSRKPVIADVAVAQIDAFGLGGVNAVAIVERSR
ncbi:MAG TPA: 3-oxoacyl-ACP synthase [Pseudonocardiaceae bacterium]|nr:3-oxoacyl-ACP synthase [Pseudonocardiaceae bacterium]